MKKIIALITLIIVLVGVGNYTNTHHKRKATVEQTKNGITTICDVTGELWTVEGVDLPKGKSVILTINDKGTYTLKDDVITKIIEVQ